MYGLPVICWLEPVFRRFVHESMQSSVKAMCSCSDLCASLISLVVGWSCIIFEQPQEHVAPLESMVSGGSPPQSYFGMSA